jgi:hypothetical protein
MKKEIKSLWAFVFCVVLLSGSPFLTAKWNIRGSQSVISWDIYGYYLYLPSFFYDDLGKLNNYDYIHNTYRPAGEAKDQAFVQPATGLYVMNYPCGMAILNLPAFAAGHIWAHAGGYTADGFTMPYQFSFVFWCVIVSLFGLWFLRQLLLRYFSDTVVAYLLIILCLATNYYCYVSFAAMTHAYLFTLYVLILCLTDAFYRREQKPLLYVVLIGVLSGLAVITRPTEIVCVLIPLLWGISDMKSLRERLHFWYTHLGVPLTFALSAFLAALPQLLYWKIYAGHWLFYSYHGDDKTFSFLHPHVLDVLISYQKGWLVYTPVMVLSILGFYQLYRQYRQMFWLIATFCLVNLYLVSSWDCWWYGGSFSMRALVQSYPLMLFPMGALIGDVLTRRLLKYLLAMFLLFCIWLNLVMHYQAIAGGIIDCDNETKAYFWRTFGKTKINRQDRKLIDTDEEIPEKEVAKLKGIYANDFEKEEQADTTMARSGKRALLLDKDKQWSPKISLSINKNSAKGWYRAKANIYYQDMEWNVWQQTQFIITLSKDGKDLKAKMMRIHRITDPGSWQEVWVDILLPDAQNYDAVNVSIWNAGGQKKIYIDDLSVSYAPL